MFDPHRIGPRRSSSYARNKGRVIQRKLVNTPSPGYTRTELEQLVPVMQKNGFIPPPAPSRDFGRMVSYSILRADDYDVSNNYRTLTSTEILSGVVEIPSSGTFVLYVPNFNVWGVLYALFRPVHTSSGGSFDLVGGTANVMTEGSRLYTISTGNSNFTLIMTGENGTVARVMMGPVDYEDAADESLSTNSIMIPM